MCNERVWQPGNVSWEPVKAKVGNRVGTWLNGNVRRTREGNREPEVPMRNQNRKITVSKRSVRKV